MPTTIQLHRTAPRWLWRVTLFLLIVLVGGGTGYGLGKLWPPAPDAPCTAGSTTPANPK